MSIYDINRYVYVMINPDIAWNVHKIVTIEIINKK